MQVWIFVTQNDQACVFKLMCGQCSLVATCSVRIKNFNLKQKYSFTGVIAQLQPVPFSRSSCMRIVITSDGSHWKTVHRKCHKKKAIEEYIILWWKSNGFPRLGSLFNGCRFEHNSIIDARPGNCSSRQFSGEQAVKPMALVFFYSWHSLSWFNWNEYVGCLLAVEKLKVLTSGYIFQIESVEQPLPFTFREEFITGEPREIG